MHTRSKTVLLSALASLAVGGLSSAFAEPPRLHSYLEVRDRVFGEPLTEAPLYCLQPRFEAQVLLALAHLPTALTERLRSTTTDPSDFKAPEPKIIHAYGICADADWDIQTEGPWTGLFARGASVPAVVRFSIGNNEPQARGGVARLFGMAVKLFPARFAGEPNETRNIHLLDETGLDGSKRGRFFGHEREGGYYTNVARSTLATGRIASALFGRFDRDPSRRPLAPLASVWADGESVFVARAPGELRLVPRISAAGMRRLQLARDRGHGLADFRDEILAYGSGAIAFDILLPDGDGADSQWYRAGSLRLGASVLSKTCDLSLHFHHHPNP